MRKKILTSLLTKIRKHIPANNLLILISVGVGITAGLVAVFLKYAVDFIQEWLAPHQSEHYTLTLLLYPLMGILLTVIYYKFIQRAKMGKSLTDVIVSIEQKSSRVDLEKTYSHVVSSALTVGFGGSTGLEAPIAVTGSAIGSNISRLFKLNYKERTVLLASGASAGIAAIFNSPIAGVLFSLEVLLAEFSLPSIIPLLVATASASVVSKILYGGQLFFAVTSGWNPSSIPFYLLFALLMGLFSVLFTKIVSSVKVFFALQRHDFRKALLGGLGLGFLIFLCPPLFGEGYHTIKAILSGNLEHVVQQNWIFHKLIYAEGSPWAFYLFIIAAIFLKPVAAALTLGAGGNGGIFAPALFVGALWGFIFSTAVNKLGLVYLPEVNFIAAGMAGALSGMLHAPLTAIFLIAEITGGYMLFVPLMIVSALSYFLSRYLEPYTLYTKRLAKKGQLIGSNKDKLVLSNMRISNLIEKNFSPISPETTLGELVDTISHSQRNLFPVLDNERHLLGIIVLDDIRELMFQREKYTTILVKDIMTTPPTVLMKDESMVKVMRKFDEHNVWNLPVLDHGQYVGFVSKSAIFSRYRDLLIKSQQEL